MNNEFAAIAKNYKRRISSSFVLVDGSKIGEKINGENFCVTKKIDGVMQVLFFRNGSASAYSSNGIEQKQLPCVEKFAELCKKSGLKSATVVAELYVTLSSSGRERVHDVSTAIASCPEKLKLATFDILDLDDQPVKLGYKEKWERMSAIFTDPQVAPVEVRSAHNKIDVEQIFHQWVVEGGAEGIVVRNETPLVYKVKERHSIDAVIIGYTVGENERCNMVRDVLAATMTSEGYLQTTLVAGSGFSDEQRQDLLEKLMPRTCASEYVQTDSRNVAFQMVSPEIVVEFSVLDLVAENSTGEAKMNMLLNYDSQKGYTVQASVAGIAAHSAIFERIRDDKSCNETDIRVSQLSDICPFSSVKPLVLANLPQSELLLRRIFTKGADEKLMIQKYTVWKTNKEDSGIFPAFVFHYTDFSCSRKDALKRDIRVSNSKDQIMQLCEAFIAENVKKGWSEML